MLKRFVLLFALVAAVTGMLVAITANAADHRDSPSVENDPSADITDVYAFRSPANNDNLVVALDVNGLTPPAEMRNFAQDVSYEIHVDNTGDLNADANVKITFSGSPLMFKAEGLGASPITGEVTPPGSAQAKVTDSGGIKVFAGPRDDAFFFDLVGFKNFVAHPAAPVTGLRPAGETPVDQFAGTNISAIVIELPITAVTGAANSNTGTIKAWASTSRGGSQVDRMAIPAINTALIPAGMKDNFNHGSPATDEAAFRATGQATIDTLRGVVDGLFGTPQDGGPLGNLTSAQVAAALIPDIVTIDFSQPVQFPNGRRLQDDVINAALGVVLNRGGSAGISDAINANDVSFASAFPYMAAPHIVAAAPSTGTGGPTSDDNHSMVWFLLGGAAIGGLALIGGGLALRRTT
jgi:hypothetical protein